jgi:hypothetical protein
MFQTPTTTRREDNVIEEEIVVGEHDDNPLELQAELLPAVVTPEMNFLRFPFFSLHRRGVRKNNRELVYEFTDVRAGKRVKSRLSVIPSVKYGRPTAFDRRVVRAIDVIIDEDFVRNGYLVENPVSFSIYRIAELMGQTVKRTGWLYRDIKESIERVVSTTVKVEKSFYFKDKKQWSGGIFHLYNKYVFKGEERNDTGEVAETNYLWLGDEYLSNINARYVKPLDYSFLASLKNDVASRLYEILSVKFYGIDDRQGYYHVDYVNLCNMLPITPQRYFSDTQRKLKPAHNELGKCGYLSKVQYVLYEGKKQVKTVRYYPGERAKREMQGKFGDRTRTVVINEQLALPLEDMQEPERTGLAQELVERGIKPKRVAVEICQNHDAEYIREKIEIFDFHMEADDGTISDNPPGWLIEAINRDIEPTQKQVKAGKTAVRKQVGERVRQLELEKEKIKKPYVEECDKIFEKIIVEYPEVVDKAVQETVEDQPILHDRYDDSKPFTEQSVMLKAMTKPKLRERFADMFKEVDEKYQSQIDEIDRQIDELKKKIA